MIEFLRRIAFKTVKKESFLGKIADRLLTKEIILYLVFGFLTTAVNLAVFFLCNRAFRAAGWEGALGSLFVKNGWTKAAELFSAKGSEYLDSTFIAWLVAVIFAFVTNKLFVFESKSWAPKTASKEFAGFMGARIFSLFVELAGMFLLVTICGFGELISKIIVGIIVIIINYLLSKLIVFKKKKPEDKEEETEEAEQ